MGCAGLSLLRALPLPPMFINLSNVHKKNNENFGFTTLGLKLHIKPGLKGSIEPGILGNLAFWSSHGLGLML
jgi:hypothetical protein